MNMITKKIKIVSALGLITALTGCQQQNISTLKHDHGNTTRFANPLQWMSLEELPYEKYREDNKNSYNIMPQNEAPIIRAWAQEWVDHIDTAIRFRYPDQLQSTPKPEVALIGSEDPNAFISPSVDCFNVNVEFTGKTGANDGVLFLSKNGPMVFSQKDLEGFACKNIDKNIMADFLEYSNSKSKDCKFDQTKDGFSVSNCELISADPSSQYAGASTIAVVRTNPYVNLQLGLINTIKNEEEFVSVIAHELGHYYRSHVNFNSGEYEYFYAQSEHGNPSYKPEPTTDEALIAIGKTIQTSAGAFKAVDKLAKPIEGTKIQPVNFLAAGNLSVMLCMQARNQGETCSDPCLNVAKVGLLPGDADQIKKLAYYPYGSKHDPEFIKEIDANMVACLEPFASFINGESPFIGSLYTPGSWKPYDQAKSFLYTWQAGLPSLIALSDVSKAANLYEVFDVIDQAIPVVKDVVKSSYKRAYDGKLGWYTAEQEADDFAVELLTYLNLNPKAGAEAFLTMQRDMMNELGDNPVTGHFGYNTCKSLYDADWKDDKGMYARVPVGDFEDDHHSMCFRAYNISREVEAHAYTVNPKDKTVNSVVSYDEVRRLSDEYLKAMSVSKEINDETSKKLSLFEKAAKESSKVDCRFEK